MFQRDKSDEALGFAQMQRLSTKRFCLDSFKSCFSKSKKNHRSSDESLNKKETKLKILEPCGQHVRRTNEIKNLDKLIEDSQHYVAKDSNYYEHMLDMSAWDNQEDSQRSNDLTSPKININDRHMSLSAYWKDSVRSKKSKIQTSKLALARARRTEMQVSSNPTESEQAELFESKKFSCLKNYCSKKCREKVYTYMSESSFLIFHRDSRIRKWCIKLLTSKSQDSSETMSENE